MSDPCAELLPAVEALIRADAGVIAAFGPNRVKVYDVPPPNALTPYVVLSATVTPDLAECFDGAEVDVVASVWSLTSPPGFVAARAIAAAVQACLLAAYAQGADLASHRIVAALPAGTRYLTDPLDGITAHAPVTVRFSTEPL